MAPGLSKWSQCSSEQNPMAFSHKWFAVLCALVVFTLSCYELKVIFSWSRRSILHNKASIYVELLIEDEAEELRNWEVIEMHILGPYLAFKSQTSEKQCITPLH